jgi:hypothetical protein
MLCTGENFCKSLLMGDDLEEPHVPGDGSLVPVMIHGSQDEQAFV